jgi:acyl-CoA synthetase (AMP-forming)/AMP-acid ligase II
LPSEIEAVLECHPSIARCAVVGRAVAGQDEIIAYVEPAPFAQVSEAALAAHCASHLPARKRPTRYVLMASLPVSPAGKIRKSELPEIAPVIARPRDSEAQSTLP